MYPMQPPWTGIGSLQSDVDSIKLDLHRKANDYEVSTLVGDVGGLARAVRDVSSVCDGLLSRLQACEESIRQIQADVIERDSQ